MGADTMTARCPPLVRSPHRSRGLSLVELMVALTLGLFLIAGMLTLLARNSNVRSELDKAARQVENGRYATQRIAEDLHNAGFYGEFSGPAAPGTPTFPAALPDPCNTGYPRGTYMTAFVRALSLPVQGVTAVASGTVPSCLDAANVVIGSNVLLVRFASPAQLLPTFTAAGFAASAASGVMYVQPNVDEARFSYRGEASPYDPATYFDSLKISSGGATNLVNAPVYRYVTRIYFLSPCSRPTSGTVCTSTADGGSPVPTLKMVELASNGTSPVFSDPISIAEGIEQLSFDYGIDSDADGAADSYVSCATCTLTDWWNVVAVRVNVLARNTEPSPDFTDAKTYNLGLAGTYTPSGAAQRYKRHAYQVQVRLNNASMRREQ